MKAGFVLVEYYLGLLVIIPVRVVVMHLSWNLQVSLNIGHIVNVFGHIIMLLGRYTLLLGFLRI